MPWKRAKALPPPDNTLFESCFRIQREACEAAGHHIPLVVENVRGAQPWVGRARWNFGSFYLWGDVPALMPTQARAVKVGGIDFNGYGTPGYKARHSTGPQKSGCAKGHKIKDQDGYERIHPNAFGWKKPAHIQQRNHRPQDGQRHDRQDTAAAQPPYRGDLPT